MSKTEQEDRTSKVEENLERKVGKKRVKEALDVLDRWAVEEKPATIIGAVIGISDDDQLDKLCNIAISFFRFFKYRIFFTGSHLYLLTI